MAGGSRGMAEASRESAPRVSRPPTLTLPSTRLCRAGGGDRGATPDLHRGQLHPRPILPSAQPPDPQRFSRRPRKKRRSFLPVFRTSRIFLAPSVLVEASSGGAGDGAEGRFSRAAALPAGVRGRRRDHRPFENAWMPGTTPGMPRSLPHPPADAGTLSHEGRGVIGWGTARRVSSTVMPALVAGIHDLNTAVSRQVVDARHEAGYDDARRAPRRPNGQAP